MKTGFICASGFNVVVSARRNGRRLIAVMLGAPSGGVRAVKVAQMLERGFQSGNFNWLTSAGTTVDQLRAIFDSPNISYRYYKNRRRLIGILSDLARALGLEKRLFR